MRFRLPHLGWSLSAGAAALLLLAPVLFLAYLAFSSGLGEFWKALGTAGNKALGVTLTLMVGVAILTAITGTGLAYLISFFDFLDGGFWPGWLFCRSPCRPILRPMALQSS